MICAQNLKQEILNTLTSLNQDIALIAIDEIVDVLRSWRTEYGESKELMEIACRKLSLDKPTVQIYIRCPQLIPVMEALRKGEPVRKLKVTMTEEGRCWWYALLILQVLSKCDGLLSHVRLVRWLSHRADAGQLRQALEYLRSSGIVDTFQVKGTDPLRPTTWHRVVGMGMENACKTT